MYIKLPFKTLGIRYERSVDIVLNLGTIEDICNEAKIEFHEISEYINTNGQVFSELLLYYGYINSCKYKRIRPRYTKRHAKVWSQRITAIEQVKVVELIKSMFTKISSMVSTKDSKKKA